MTVVFPSYGWFLAARGLDPGPNDGYDYGVWWRDNVGGVYRLTWLGPRQRTIGSDPAGELYLVSLRGSRAKSVELLCVIPPAHTGEPDANVEAILEGWADVCGRDGSTDWLYERVRAAVASGAALAADAGEMG